MYTHTHTHTHTQTHNTHTHCTGDQEQVLALLLGSAEGEEECRNVVAECLGRLAQLAPEKARVASLAAIPWGRA